MQFSPSTSSADTSLAAALFPAAGPVAPGTAAAPAEAAAGTFETVFAGLTPGIAAAPAAVAAAVSTSGSEPVFPVAPAGLPAQRVVASRPGTETPPALPVGATPTVVGPDTAAAVSLRPISAKSKAARSAEVAAAGNEPGVASAPAAKTAPAADPKLAAEALAAFLPVPLAPEPVTDVVVGIETEEETSHEEAGEEMGGLEGETEEDGTASDIPNTAASLPPSVPQAGRTRDSGASAVVAYEPASATRAAASRPFATHSSSGNPRGDAGVLAHQDAESDNLAAKPTVSGQPLAVAPRPTDFLPQRDLERIAINRVQTVPIGSGETATASPTSRSTGDLATVAVPPVAPLSTGMPTPAPFAGLESARAGGEPAVAGLVPAPSPDADLPGLGVRITVESAPTRVAMPASPEARPAIQSNGADISAKAASDAGTIAAAAETLRPEMAPGSRRTSERRNADAVPVAQTAGENRPAILAAPRDLRAPAEDEAKNSGDKTFLNAEGERVAKRSPVLGTAVANRELAMYSRTLSSLPTHPASGYEGTAAGLAPAVGSAPADLPDTAPVQVVANPHRAVEAVLTAVDRAAGREQTSVNLDFAIGRESLAVRVELHDGEVRATFRTESPELRAALAHEWQQAAAGGDRTLKLAPAAFVASERDPQSGQSGEESSRQQDRQAWADDAREQAQVRTLLSRRADESAPSERPMPALRPALSANSARLNLFA